MPAPAPDEDLDTFGRLVRVTRKRKKLSQDELARMTHITQSDLSALERGDRQVKASHIVKLCKALGLDVGTLTEAAADRQAAADKDRHGAPSGVYGTADDGIADPTMDSAAESKGAA